MPLFKKKAFELVKIPDDLRPDEQVWQVRFTKEVFRDYEEYLKRVNLYRRRVWTCKVTGKMHLTYEEALISEYQANEKTQGFPKAFMADTLRLVQFSLLRLNNLVTMIYERFKDHFVEGEELHGKTKNPLCRCKILKVITNNKGVSYEVGWLDEDGKIKDTSIQDAKNLTRRKLPFSRGLLKLFIKESTFQSAPWVVHDKLAKENGISTEPPDELREKIMRNQKKTLDLGYKKGNKKKRKGLENDNNSSILKKAKAGDPISQSGLASSKISQKEERPKVTKIKYPIDDLLVKPCADDPVFSKRPVLSTNFLVPMDNVGDLLMVWDFCSAFSKLLHLSPFSLEEFEQAIAYEGASNLIVEVHSALLNLLIEDHGEYYTLIQQKKRKEMVTSKNWAEYLIDFLELESVTHSADHLGKIKRGQHYMLSVGVKLEILGRLICWVLSTDVIREQLDKYMEKYNALLATKKVETRRIREEKRLKETKDGNKETQKAKDGPEAARLQEFDSMKSCSRTSDEVENVKAEVHTSIEINHLAKSESKHDTLASRRANMKRNMESKIAEEREKETARTLELKKLREEKKEKDKEARERKLKEQRQEQFDREMEKLFIRTNTLGKDREHNSYWFFQREGRVFVESADHKQWGFYTCKEELDELMGSLNPKGVREMALKKQLEKHYQKICSALQRRARDMAQRVILDTAVLRRSVRVTVQPEDSKVPVFLRYVNKWRD